MDALLVAAAFVMGLAAHLMRLPPLVGFLAAGFGLHAAGFEGGDTLRYVSDLGITLLLFTIGLKLRVRDLLHAEIWAGATLHMAITVGVFAAVLASSGGLFAAGLSRGGVLLVAFALSFSSTVFTVKVLDEKGERGALYGRTAVGILIMQDVIAVLFMTFASAGPPSPWAVGLLGLLPLRPLAVRLLARVGHGELLILTGFAAAVVGASLFELAGLKGDVGALVLGMLLAGSDRAEELARSLLAFKDLFLVGFFLSIGLYGVPAPGILAVAVALALVVPLKLALFAWLLARFHLRARTAFLAALSLATYSEFGLIVGALGVDLGWLGPEWLGAIAIALSVSMAVAAPLNVRGHQLFERLRVPLRRIETGRVHPDDRPIDPGAAEVIVFGMGRVGTAAFDGLRERYGDVVVGVDYDADAVSDHRQAGRHVILGDPTDCDFWDRTHDASRIRVALLAMPDHDANLEAIAAIRSRAFTCEIAAVARYDDEVEALREAGATAALDFYAETGAGFAESVASRLEEVGFAPESPPRDG